MFTSNDDTQTMKIHEMTRPAWMSFLIIVVIAATVRMGDLGRTTTFRYDQGQLALLTHQAASGEAFPWLGIQSSVGVPNSPMTVYVLVPLFWLTSNPLIINLLIALWNVVGVGIFWWFIHRYFGLEVASIAALAYAVSPHAVLYSRKIWAQDYHTPFIIMAFFLGFLGFREGKRWAQVLALPILLIGIQIHFAAWTLLPLYLWFLFIGWRRNNLSWAHIVASGLLGVLMVLPFVVGLSQESGGAVQRAGRIAALVQDGLRFRWYPVQQVVDLTTGTNLLSTTRNEASSLVHTIAHAGMLWQLLGISALVGIVAVLLPRWRNYAIFIWLWAGITLAAFVPNWTGSGIYHHYFVPTLPALALLIALGAVATRLGLAFIVKSQRLSYSLYVILIAAFISQSLWLFYLYDYSLNNYTVINEQGQTATPLDYLLEVREALQEYDDVLILGANPHESNYYVWEPLLYDSATCVRDLLINGGGIDVLPSGSYAVLVAPLAPINTNYEVPDRYQNDNRLEIPLREGEDPYIVYGFDEAPQWTETPIVAVDAPRFKNGIRLTGYYLTDEWLQLRWEVWRTPGTTYQYFAHFLDANGEKIGQRDAPFYVGQHWCDGDTLITTVPIDLPEGTESLRVGMYTLDADGGTTNQNLIDDSGNVINSWVDVEIDAP